MIQEINTVQDVITFIALLAEEVNDSNPFEELRRHHIYTPEEAALRAALMDKCFEVCAAQSMNFKSLAAVIFKEAIEHP